MGAIEEAKQLYLLYLCLSAIFYVCLLFYLLHPQREEYQGKHW